MVTSHDHPGSYALPLLLALAVHAAVVAVLWVNWTPTVDTSRVIRPHIVMAELLVMTPKPKQAAKPQPQQAPPPKPAPKPVPRVEPKPAPKPETVPKPAPKPDPAIAKRAEDARRAQALERLSTSAFDDALAREAQELSKDSTEQAAMSYFDAMRPLMYSNWIIPPSAKNGMEAVVAIDLVPTGDVVGVTLIRSSGSDAFDRSAIQAVRKAAKFDVPKESTLFERHFRRFNMSFKPEDLMR
jgi:colicin import membrane protein